jgi:hypothetical protein
MTRGLLLGAQASWHWSTSARASFASSTAGTRPIAYDYGVNMAFATWADLDAYGPNPDHQAVVALEREFADWIICDYEV